MADAALLAGDVGGTKTALAVVSAEKGPRAPLAEIALPSAGYPSLEALVLDFLGRTSVKIGRACFGVAGPVAGGRARITNLPWLIDAARLGEALGVGEVQLLNDLEALACALPALPASEVLTLSAGEPDPSGNLAVIAPGTGHGEAFLTRRGGRLRAHASEGGHADFAPQGGLEIDLLRFLEGRFGHVSYERICSGTGLPNIYAFLKESGAAPEPPWLAERLAAAPAPPPASGGAALAGEPRCELCRATLRAFVSVLGAEAGNLALKALATGGVYLAGGIPPRILPALTDGLLLESFRRKGRLRDLMHRIPVHVILNSKAPLIGAASFALAREPSDA